MTRVWPSVALILAGLALLTLDHHLDEPSWCRVEVYLPTERCIEPAMRNLLFALAFLGNTLIFVGFLAAPPVERRVAVVLVGAYVVGVALAFTPVRRYLGWYLDEPFLSTTLLLVAIPAGLLVFRKPDGARIAATTITILAVHGRWHGLQRALLVADAP